MRVTASIAAVIVLLTSSHEVRAQMQAAPASQDQRTTRAGIYTAEQAERGKMAYAVSCRSCHTAASHTGVTFAKWWKGRSVGDLYGFMSTQMPKNDPGSLDAAQYADVVAYLLKMNAMPAGASELLPDSTSLAQIRIELPEKAPKTASAAKSKPKSPTRTKGP